MTDSSAELEEVLKLSQPTIADGEIHFSAYGPDWGLCSYAVPIRVARESLGVKDLSAPQLLLAFQLNRQRITAAVAQGGARDPARRAILSKI